MQRVIENSKQISQKLKKIHYGVISRQNRFEKANELRKQKLSFRFVPTQSVIENSKKIAKKFKKLKNTIMASFEAKIGWKRSRKRENKNYRSVPFLSYPKRNRKFQKNSKIFQKIKKIQFRRHSKPKLVGKG